MRVFIVCLLLGSSLAATQNPINKDVPSNLPKNHPAAKAKSESFPTVPFNSPPAQRDSGTNTNHDQQNADNRSYRIEVVPQADWWFKGYVIFNGLLVLVNLGMLLVIRRQRKAMEEQRGIMSGQLTAMQNQLSEMQKTREQTIEQMKSAGSQTGDLIRQGAAQVAALNITAGAAQTSAQAAKRSADALIVTERPWVFMTLRDGVKIRWRDIPGGKAENVMYFESFLSNYGKTPAFVYEVFAFLEIRTAGQVDILRDTGFPANAKPLRPDAFVIAPDCAHELPGIQMAQFWTDSQAAAVMKKDAFLVAYGLIRYRDAISPKDTHETPFLAVYVWADNFDKGIWRRFYDASSNKHT